MPRGARFSNQSKWILAGAALTVLPFLYCAIFGFTFVPMDALYSLMLPYADKPGPVPVTHFWVELTNFYWPRMSLIARGEFPISYATGGGIPIFADTIGGFFYPPWWLITRILGNSHLCWDVFWIFHYLLLFAGMVFWLGRKKENLNGAVVGALLAVFSTAYFPGSYMSLQTLAPLAYVPILFAIEERLAMRRSAHRFWILPLILAISILAGNLQISVFPLLMYAIWKLLRREFRSLAYVGGVAILLTLPYWLTAVEYHVFLNTVPFIERHLHSQVPLSLAAKLKALLAIPALFVPELYGSPASVDLLKVFNTSATYFIGSIGIIGMLMALAGLKRRHLKNPELKYGLVLVVFTFFVILTPLLHFLYYRFFSVTCLGFAIIFARVAYVTEYRTYRRLAAPVLALLVAAAAAWIVVRHSEGVRIAAYLQNKLEASSQYAWFTELQRVRVERFMGGYLRDFSFIATVLLLAISIGMARIRPRWLPVLAVLGGLVTWSGFVSIHRVREVNHPALKLIARTLAEYPNAPLSRYEVLPCGPGPLLFNFPIQEYVRGANKLDYYGSTQGPVICGPIYQCNNETRTITFEDREVWRRLGVNVFITRAGWKPDDAEFVRIFTARQYSIWKRSSHASSIVWPLAASALVHSRIEKADSSGFRLALDVDHAIGSWALSLANNPGWQFKLDRDSISPRPAAYGSSELFQFDSVISRGHHVLTAHYTPWMLFFGLCGTLLGVILMLYTSVRKRVARA